MFSSRTRWDRVRNRLSAALEARRQAGAPVLDLTESNPTRAQLRYPDDLLLPLSESGSLVYEPDPKGLRLAREAVATDYARRGARVSAERVILTASTSEAYSLLFKLLCDPGDAVLAPRPSYPLFEFLAGLDAVRLDGYSSRYDGEWHIALETLDEGATRRTRAILAVSPGNPTGAYLKRDELAALERLSTDRGLALIVDEVFSDYSVEDDPRRVATVAGERPVLTFSLGGLSKSCGLPQLKLGWIAVAGPADRVDEALSRLVIVADTYLSVATPVQRAAPRLLSRLEELQAPIRERLRANRDVLARALGPDSPASLLHIEGGWYAVLRVPATLPEEERAVRLLEDRETLVHPGYFFDFESEAHLVLSLLTPTAIFSEGLSRVLEDVASS